MKLPEAISKALIIDQKRREEEELRKRLKESKKGEAK